MTREQATQNIDEIDFLTWQIDIIEDMLDQIFNDHEAQLKAKDEITQDIKEAYELKSIAYDLLLEAIKLKDEEIERLKQQLSSVHNLMYRNGYSDAIDCYDTFGNFNTRHKPNAKARSIVAMLFWRAKKDKRLADEENKYFTYDMALHSFILFKQAYKMLKDNK